MRSTWDDYRRRRNQFLLVFPTGLFAVWAFIWLFSRVAPGQVMSWVFVILGILLMAAFIITGIRLQTFRCPRCGKFFFIACWYRTLFARRCVHCKLPMWQNTQSDATPTI
jgi:hypothetical protein